MYTSKKEKPILVSFSTLYSELEIISVSTSGLSISPISYYLLSHISTTTLRKYKQF